MIEFPPIPEWTKHSHWPYQSFAYTEDDWYPNFTDTNGEKNLVLVSVVPIGHPTVYYNVLIRGADDTAMILSVQDQDSAIRLAQWIASDIVSRKFLQYIGFKRD